MSPFPSFTFFNLTSYSSFTSFSIFTYIVALPFHFSHLFRFLISLSSFVYPSVSISFLLPFSSTLRPPVFFPSFYTFIPSINLFFLGHFFSSLPLFHLISSPSLILSPFLFCFQNVLRLLCYFSFLFCIFLIFLTLLQIFLNSSHFLLFIPFLSYDISS